MTDEVAILAAAFDDQDDAEHVKQRKRIAARRFLWEAVLYFLFVSIFCTSATQGRPAEAYDTAEVARTMFVDADYSDPQTGRLTTLKNVSSVDEVYVWMSEVLVPNAFPTESGFVGGARLSPYSRRQMFGFNHRIGTVRLRQLRVKSEVGCKVSRVAADIITSCWPEYTPEYEETAPFGPSSNRTKYRHRTGEELCSELAKKYCITITFGRKGAAYSANGYVVDLPTDHDKALGVVDSLKADKWLDYPTRVLIIDLNFFNPSSRIFVALEIFIEFWPTGSVVVSYSTKPIPSMSLVQARDYLVFVFDIILIVFVALYFVQEVREVVTHLRVSRHECVKCVHDRILSTGVATAMLCPGCQKREFYPMATPQCPLCHLEMSLDQHKCWRGYVLDVWNWVDVIAQGLFIGIFVSRMSIRFDLSAIQVDRVRDAFILLYPLAWQYIVVDWIYSVMSLFLVAKLFKYLGRFRPLATLVRTLSNAKMELLYFLIIFFALFLGFAFAFYLAFGTDVAGYSSWTTAQIFLFQIVLGSIDYNALSRSNRLLAPAYLILYTLLVFFVLANVFIAIISASHEEALGQLRRDRDDFLSSALKLEVNRIRLKIARFMGWETKAMVLVYNFAKGLSMCRYLSQVQRDNVRAFMKELDQDVYSQVGSEVIAHVVLALTPQRLEQPAEALTGDDFLALAAAVRDFKQFKKLEEESLRRGVSGMQFRLQPNEVIDRVLGPVIFKTGPPPNAEDPDGTRGAASDNGSPSAGGKKAGSPDGQGSPRGMSRNLSTNIPGGGRGADRERNSAILGSRSATVADVEKVLDDIEARQQRVLEALKLLTEDLEPSKVGPSDWVAPSMRP